MFFAPFTHNNNATPKIMLCVCFALMPAVVTALIIFKGNFLKTLIMAIVASYTFEYIMLYMRNRHIKIFIKDMSALVTALLLALTLPAQSPWWIVCVACFFAFVIAKHLYGSLGQNMFNPAMVGYAVCLVSFPAHMTSIQIPDVVVGATALDSLMHLDGNSIDTIIASAQHANKFGYFGAAGSEWMNLAFLIGGIVLIYKKVIIWQQSISMLVAISLLSMFYYLYDNNTNASVLFHLFSGATMCGAFFIITDPVTNVSSVPGKIIAGTFVGILVFLIRKYGSYADGVAFATLLMNACAPMIDYFSKPRVYGH